MIDVDCYSEIEEVDSGEIIPMNKSFGRRLALLQHQAIYAQYQLAYFNTLGGAYHLCDHPREAFLIAKQQEFLGRRLGSTTLVIRAKGYQAVNLGLLGSKRKAALLFKDLETRAKNEGSEQLVSFICALRMWTATQTAEALLK